MGGSSPSGSAGICIRPVADEDLLSALQPVAEAFDALGIPYLLGGSVASSLYGMPRSTADADLVAAVEEKHADPLAELLSPSYYVDADMIRDAVARRGMFNVVHSGTALKVDVYVLKADPWDQEAFRRRRGDKLSDAPDAKSFSVGSAEDILLHKLVWYRAGGEVSERQWGDVLGILRVQRTALDTGYLDRWAPILGVADLLARARSEAGDSAV